MELERLEVVFDGDLSPFEQKLEVMQQKFDAILGRMKQTADANTEVVENNFSQFKGFDKFTKQIEKLNANFDKQMQQMNKSSQLAGQSVNKNLSNWNFTGIANGIKQLERLTQQTEECSKRYKTISNKMLDIPVSTNGITKSLSEWQKEAMQKKDKMAFEVDKAISNWQKQVATRKIPINFECEKALNNLDKKITDRKVIPKINTSKLTNSITEIGQKSKQMKNSVIKESQEMAEGLSENMLRGTTKLTKDVQTAVDKVNLKMQQARAAQVKLANLTADRNGAKLSGDKQAVSKIQEKMANAQIQMNRSQMQAQSIVRGLKNEYAAIPNSLNSISAKMEANERQIESMRAKITTLKAEMRMQQTETGSFASGKWQSTGFKDTPNSTKTAEAISKQSRQMEKLIAENNALQRSYAQLEDRSSILKTALSKVNTELGEMPIKTNMASNGMRNLSGSSKQSQGLFTRFGNVVKNSVGRIGSLFTRQSNQVTSGTSRMSRGMNGFGGSLRMLWSQLFIFTFLYQGITTLVGALWKALKTNAQFSASLNQIKVNLLTAFYPIYQAVLPAINALMSGVAKVTGYIASFISTLFGMNIGDAFSGAQGLASNVKALEDTGAAADDASDGYDDMVKSIRKSNKELKKQHDKTEKARKKMQEYKRLLAGFDELNILDFDDHEFEKEEFEPQEIPDRSKSPKAGGVPWADFGAATVPDTPKWLTDFAKSFKDTISKLFDPIKKAWDAQGKKVMTAWKYALHEVWSLVKEIGKSFMKVWTNGTGQKFVENLLILLADALNIVGDIAQAFRIAWTENERGTQLIQQIFDALNAWLELLHQVAFSFREIWNNGTGVEICKQILDLLTNVFQLLETIGTAFKEAWNDNGNGQALIQALLDMFIQIFELINSITTSFDAAFASGIGEAILSNIFQIITNIFTMVGNLAGSFSKVWNENDRGKSIFERILNIANTIFGTINQMTKVTADWAAKLDFTPLLESIDGLLQSISPLTKTVFDGLEWAYNNIFLPLTNYTIEDLLPAFLDTLSAALDVLNSVIEALQPLGQWLWDNFLQPIAEWTGGVIIDVLKSVGDGLKNISDWIEEHQTFVENFAIVVGSFAAAWGAVNLAVGIWNGIAVVATAVTGAFAGVVAVLTSPVTLVILAIGALIAVGVLLWKNWDTIKEKAGQLKEWLVQKWEGIKEKTAESWENIKKWITEKFHTAVEFVKEKAVVIKEWVVEKWNILKEKAIEIFQTLKEKIKEIFSAIVNAAKEKVGSIKDSIVNGFTNAKNTAINIFTTMKEKITTTLTNIIDEAKKLPGKIATGLSNGISAIGNAVKEIANTLINPIGTAVNGVIGGVNWVLDAVNVSWRIPEWSVPHFYAKGTSYHPGGLAVVNDALGSRYQEMFKLPNGQLGMFPKQRNLLVDLPRGTQVLPANQVPQYKDGIFSTFKDFFSKGFDKAKGIAKGVWDVISDPSKLVDMAIDKFVNLSNILEPMISIAKGIVSTAKNAVVNFVVDTINKFTGFANGGRVDRYGWYQLAEGNNTEWIIPVTKPQLAFQRINEALDFMGYEGIPELTMPEVFKDSSDGYNGTVKSTKQTLRTMFVSGNDMENLSDNLILALGEKIANAVITACYQMNFDKKNKQPIEVILQVDTTKLGQVAIKGINQYHEKTGTMQLNL